MEVDVQDLDMDFLAFSIHKMCGPRGVGILYGKKDLLNPADGVMEPAMLGGGTVSDTTYDSYSLLGSPECFEVGVQNYPGQIAAGVAVKYIQQVELDRIQAHEVRLNSYLTEQLLKRYGETGWFRIIGPSDAAKEIGMYGYINRLLAVDLTNGQWDVISVNSDHVRNYIGGRGLGARYLWDLLPPASDPLGPENVAIMMTGPFTGTEVYSCQKYEWVTKSPLAGTYLCSNCGGMLGVNLRKAGYDGLILKGASDRPRYLFIDETGPELRDATAVWGQTVSQTQALLRAQVGPTAAIGCIGPAGEPPRSVRFASFFDGQRSAGRGGLGAVLGSKRLKAIAVVPGRQEVPVYDLEGLSKLLPELASTLKQDRISGDAIPAVGSMIWLDALALDGLLPIQNYQASATYDQIRGRVDSNTYRTQFIQPPKAGNGSSI